MQQGGGSPSPSPIALNSSQLLRDPSELDLDRVPNRLVHRHEQRALLWQTLQPLLEGSLPCNALLMGRPGTGKTVLARALASDFASEASSRNLKVDTAYVNCLINKGVFDVTYAIARQIFPGSLKRGESRASYVDAVRGVAERADGLILVMDEIDQLALHKTREFNDLLYLVSREFPRTAVLMLTNNRRVELVLHRELDQKTFDTFTWRTIHFPPYNPTQLWDILKPRSALAFLFGVLDERVGRYICSCCAANGLGARGVLTVAKEAGRSAEENGGLTISYTDVDKAVLYQLGDSLASPLRDCDGKCIIILQHLIDKGARSGRELESWWPESREGLYHHLGHLRDNGLIPPRALRTARASGGKGSEGRFEVEHLLFEPIRQGLAEYWEAQGTES